MKKKLAVLTAAFAVALGAGFGVFQMVSGIPDRFAVFEDTQIVSSYPVSVQTTVRETADAKLFGLVPVKEVQVDKVERKKLLPGGMPFGIKLYTEGVMVVGMSEIETAEGNCRPAADAGIEISDIITEIDGIPVRTNEEVSALIGRAGGKSLIFQLVRQGEQKTVTFQPALCKTDNQYKAGLWVRDSTAGIGTVTFVEPETGALGGLGHGICDIDTGEIMPLLTGSMVKANIEGVVPGKRGEPGELIGSFDNSVVYGSLQKNTAAGVYGRAERTADFVGTPLEVASVNEIKEGPAQIISTVDENGPALYDIKITRVMRGSGYQSKNMVIKVTDKKLVEKTGGIVQGMSGSPIIQNGKLVGAVTHVLVGDPQSGFGIFIENMVAETENLN